MGNFSSQQNMEPINYNCPVCMKTGKIPNIAGKFFIINLKECQCNGCNTIYPKSKYYKPIIQ